MKAGWNMTGSEEDLGPHVWSAAFVQEQFTTIAAIILRIILSFLYCCSPEGKGTVIKKQIQHLLFICTSAQTTLWLQTCKRKKGKKKVNYPSKIEDMRSKKVRDKCKTFRIFVSCFIESSCYSALITSNMIQDWGPGVVKNLLQEVWVRWRCTLQIAPHFPDGNLWFSLQK